MTPTTNRTGVPGTTFEQAFYKGNRYLCFVLKQVYAVDAKGQLHRLEDQPPLEPLDVFEAEPWKSSLRYPSDATPWKPATDVVIVGHAKPPGNKPVDAWAAQFKIGPLHKAITLHGPSEWQHQRVGGWKQSAKEPTSAVKLCWENAFGGLVGPWDKPKAVFDPNPLGTGYFGEGFRRESPDTGRTYRVPQVQGSLAITRFDKLYEPVGVSPISGFFADRKKHMGSWPDPEQAEITAIPDDMDLHYWCAAPADQRVDDYLVGNETLWLEGFLPEGLVSIALPGERWTAVAHLPGDARDSVPLNLDLVHLDLDTRRLTLRWNAIFPLYRNAEHFVLLPDFPAPPPKEVVQPIAVEPVRR